MDVFFACCCPGILNAYVGWFLQTKEQRYSISELSRHIQVLSRYIIINTNSTIRTLLYWFKKSNSIWWNCDYNDVIEVPILLGIGHSLILTKYQSDSHVVLNHWLRQKTITVLALIYFCADAILIQFPVPFMEKFEVKHINL